VPDGARPGQFAALSVGGPTSAHLLRRCFSIHRVRSSGPKGPTVEVVVAAHGRGTEWLTRMRTHDETSIIGPLGRPFPLPTEAVPCVLVGGGYGSAPLFWLAESLRGRGCPVHLVLGAATQSRLFGVPEARRYADEVTVTTDDGSLGHRGWVSDVLPDLVRRSGAGVVYGCGPMDMLRAVTQIASDHGAVAQVAVEEAMACGVGVCMTCVLPVRGADGRTRMVRSCAEGPVFRGDLVRWDALHDGVCRVPEDAVGAPKVGGH
jgi:dihydroorotate dehydrogenase electron transfer subunit